MSKLSRVSRWRIRPVPGRSAGPPAPGPGPGGESVTVRRRIMISIRIQLALELGKFKTFSAFSVPVTLRYGHGIYQVYTWFIPGIHKKFGRRSLKNSGGFSTGIEHRAIAAKLRYVISEVNM
jgi:hypothetical protein